MNDDIAGTGAVLALWNDVTPDVDAEYNTWHASEHVPERLTVPGMLWGRRYRRLCNSAAPRYLTIYGMRDAQVLESDAYRLLLSRPTPMSARMRRICATCRVGCAMFARRLDASHQPTWPCGRSMRKMRLACAQMNTHPAPTTCCSPSDRPTQRRCPG